MKSKNQYSWNAADYAKHSSVQQTWARELISKLKLKGHESVLDVGCGDGKVSAEIARYLPNGNVLGVDSSNDMIELACADFPQQQHPNLSFQLADARYLPFREQFDIVFSNAALHWIKNHDPVISGIQNSLKPGGRILLQMGGKGNADSIFSASESILSKDEWHGFFTGFKFPYGFYDPEEYMSYLEKRALIPVRVELIPKVMSYDDKEGLAAWIRTTWLPYTQRVPDDKREAFIEQIVDEYVGNHPFDHYGKVHVNMVRLEVEAIKSK